MATSGTLTAFPSGVVTVTAATGIAEAENMPAYVLLQNYPNPFNSSAMISYQIVFYAKRAKKALRSQSVKLSYLGVFAKTLRDS